MKSLKYSFLAFTAAIGTHVCASAQTNAEAQPTTQITTSGNCTINIVRSSARDVRVTGCVRDSAKVATLQRTINAIFANQSVEISRIDDMIAAMNLFFAESAQNQETILEATAVSNDKLDRIIDFLESFQEKPEDAAGLIPLLSDGSLSHIQERKPFGIQLVRIVKYTNDSIRVILRLVPSGPENFDVAIRTKRSGPAYNPYETNTLEDWSIIGLYGTTCRIERVPDVMPIATHFTPGNFSEMVDLRGSRTENFPITLIVVANCTGRVTGEDRTLNMRFHYRPTGSNEVWKTVDFRFDATDVTQLYPVNN